jgi:hypothetical protein
MMQSNPLRPPSSNEVENVFLDLTSGRLSREDADVWAGQWVYADEPPDMEDSLWEALLHLAGCDLQLPGGEYLHSDEQVQEWLNQFRAHTNTVG